MYFEFESSNSNDNDVNIKSKDNCKQLNESTLSLQSTQCCSSTPSRRKLFGSTHSLSMSSTSSAKLTTEFTSPLQTSPNISQRYRRYSMHSDPLFMLDALPDDNNSTFCDLALITKKKLLQLNNNHLKSNVDSVSDPDVKLNQPFVKHSNSDLRREVLLSSVQRSLSVSSDDLHCLTTGKSGGLYQSTSKNENNGNFDDISMEFVNSGDKFKDVSPQLSISSNDTSFGQTPMSIEVQSLKIPRIFKNKKGLTLSSYTPPENQFNGMSSSTFTSTTSMAGTKNSLNPGANCRNYMKKLNFDLIKGNTSTNNSYYYSNSTQPKLTLTMSYSMLKKRLHSSSPSKYSSPYHTVSNAVCKDFNLIFANASNNQLPTEWDLASKRLKVMHTGTDYDQMERKDDAPIYNNTDTIHHQPESELNQLAQDFHRLKTPFT